ncbi:MAG: hypothetical protein Fur0022_17690 [Anaerolineales bacterium]
MNKPRELQPPQRKMGQLWRNKLFGPSSQLTNVAERRQAEILAVFAFIIMLSTSMGAVATLAATPGVIRPSSISLGITALLAINAYVLSRTKAHLWGAVLLTFALSLSAFLTVMGGTDTPSSTIYSAVPIALLIASALLPVRGFVIVLLFNLAWILSLPLITNAIVMRDVISTFGVVGTFGFLLIAIGNVRDEIERERLTEYKLANDALEGMKVSLEALVQERSKSLSDALRIARLGNWEYDFLKDEFTFNDDFYAMMRTTAEREGGYKMNAATYAARFVHPEDAPIVGAEIGKSVETTDPNYQAKIDHRVIFGDGEPGYVTVRFRIQKDAQGRTIKSFGANQDITESKIKEAQLTNALSIARLGNWEYDFLKDEFTFNDDFYAMMRTTAAREGGYKMNAATYAARFVHPEDAPIVGAEIGKSVETTDPNYQTEITHRVIFGDGEPGYVTVRFRIEKDAAGRTVKSYGANQDITEQKNLQAQLSEALRIARIGNWEYDLLKDEFTFNDDFYAMMRTTAEQEGGYKMSAARYTERFVYPEDAPTVGLEIGKAVETTDPNFSVQVDHRVIFGDGKLGYVNVRFRVEKDPQGRTIKTYGANQDITERKEAEAILAKRAKELETVTQLATAISTSANPQEMLKYVSELTKERFGFYHVHVYLLDEEDSMLKLAAGAGEAGDTMVARGHAIPLAREQSLVARAARTREGVLANDITLAPDFLPNPLLPETRSELAVPLLVRDQVLGVLDIQSAQVNAFTEEDIRIQTILAAEIAVTLETTRAIDQNEKTLHELDALTHRLVHEGWQSYLYQKERSWLGYVYEGNSLKPVTPEQPSELVAAQHTFIQPVTIRGEKIGQLTVVEPQIEDPELDVVLAAISSGLSAHLENLRLTEEAERRVDELRIINTIGQALTAEVELQPILITIVNNLNEVFKADIVYIALYDEANKQIEIPYMLDDGFPVFDEAPFPMGEGITSTIIRTRQPVFINQNSAQRLAELGALPTTQSNKMAKSFIGVPLLAGEHVLGVISVQDTRSEGRFSESDVNLLRTIATNASSAIQNARLFVQIQKRAMREAKTNLISQKILSATTIPDALQTAIQELGVALKARRTIVELGQKNAKEVVP